MTASIEKLTKLNIWFHYYNICCVTRLSLHLEFEGRFSEFIVEFYFKCYPLSPSCAVIVGNMGRWQNALLIVRYTDI